MRWLLAALLLLGCAAPEPTPGFALLPVVERSTEAQTCDSAFGRVGRMELGGSFTSVAASERWIHAATGTSVMRFSRVGGLEPTLFSRFEASALWLEGDRLWIADRSQGLSRLDGADSPGTSTLTSWRTGGSVVALADAGGAIWAADATGRVLRLPLGASASDPVEQVEVDGAPSSLAPWGDGVVVAAGGAGLLLVTPGAAGLEVRSAPWSPSWPSRVATAGDVLYVAASQTVFRWDGVGPTREVEVPQRALALLPRGDGVLIAAQAAGLHRWDGDSETTSGWDASAIAGRTGFSADGLFAVSEDEVLVAGGLLGVVEAYRVDGDWIAGAVRGAGGLITAIEPVGDELVVGLATWNNAGRLVGLRDEGAAGLHVAWESDAGGWPSRILPWRSGLLVARRGGGGLGFVGAARDGPAKLVALEDSSVNGVATAGEDQVVTVSMDRTLHRLQVTADGGWSTLGSAEIPRLPMPVDVVVRGDSAWTATGASGMAWRWDGPGESPVPVRALAAPAGHVDQVFRLARVRDLEGRLWVGLPRLGLERLSFDSDESEVVRFTPGAWDVVRWGEDLVVARGEAGISLLSEEPELALGPTCHLPGKARRLAVWNGRLLVASDGSLFVLDR